MSDPTHLLCLPYAASSRRHASKRKKPARCACPIWSAAAAPAALAAGARPSWRRNQLHPPARARPGPRPGPARGADGPLPLAPLQQGQRRATRPGLGLHHALPLAGEHRPHHQVLTPPHWNCTTKPPRALCWPSWRPGLPRTASNCTTTSPRAGWPAASCLMDLATASLERVLRRDVAAWMPESPQRAARTLHRLHSEMQMLLYTHPVNDARGARPAGRQLVLGAAAPAPCPRRPPPPPPAVPTTCARAPCAKTGAAWARPGSAGRRPRGRSAAARQSESGEPCNSRCAASARRASQRPRAWQAHSSFFRPQRFMDVRLSSYENNSKRHSPPRRLGAGAGRRAPAAGAPVRRARRARPRRTGRRPGAPAAAQPAEGRQRGRRAAGRRHRRAPAPVHRGRLRLRRRHRLRRGVRGLRLLGAPTWTTWCPTAWWTATASRRRSPARGRNAAPMC
jgi:hypothetical protein